MNGFSSAHVYLCPGVCSTICCVTTDLRRVPFPLPPKGEQPTGRTFFVVVATFHREITSSPRPTNRPRWNLVVTVLSSCFPPCCDKLLEDRETLEDADRVLMQRAGKKRSGGRRKCGFTCSRKLGRRWIIVRMLITRRKSSTVDYVGEVWKVFSL